MWYQAGKFILKHRFPLLVLLALATGFMGWQASKVQLSYDFTRALPTDNPKYQDYQAFLKEFGGDGNTMVIGIGSEKFYNKEFFNEVADLHQRLKKVSGVTDILSIPEVVTLKNDSVTKKLVPEKIFHYPYSSQALLDSDRAVLENLPFYRGLLYNADSHSYLLAVNVNRTPSTAKAGQGSSTISCTKCSCSKRRPPVRCTAVACLSSGPPSVTALRTR